MLRLKLWLFSDVPDYGRATAALVAAVIGL
jgi:hypothetical protein